MQIKIRLFVYGYFILNMTIATLCATSAKKIIMIDPAGDTNYAGRIIARTFERGITLQCAQQLKERCEKIIPSCSVHLARQPGETIKWEQKASHANSLNCDLYITLHFYHEKNENIRLSIYHYTLEKTSLVSTTPTELAFYPCDQAYKIQESQTHAWASLLEQYLCTNQYADLFECNGVFALPFKPLCGITAPAFGVEIGLKKEDDMNTIIEPLATAIQQLFLTKT